MSSTTDDQEAGDRFMVSELSGRADRFCAYQERCISEVRDKLLEWGASEDQAETVIETLTAADLLNDQRYATAYASGRFRIKKWGRVKIRHHLSAKRIGSADIQAALEAIDGDEYYRVLREMVIQKASSVRDNDLFYKRGKVARFLAGRGFESDLIWDLVKEEITG